MTPWAADMEATSHARDVMTLRVQLINLESYLKSAAQKRQRWPRAYRRGRAPISELPRHEATHWRRRPRAALGRDVSALQVSRGCTEAAAPRKSSSSFLERPRGRTLRFAPPAHPKKKGKSCLSPARWMLAASVPTRRKPGLLPCGGAQKHLQETRLSEAPVLEPVPEPRHGRKRDKRRPETSRRASSSGSCSKIGRTCCTLREPGTSWPLRCTARRPPQGLFVAVTPHRLPGHSRPRRGKKHLSWNSYGLRLRPAQAAPSVHGASTRGQLFVLSRRKVTERPGVFQGQTWRKRKSSLNSDTQGTRKSAEGPWSDLKSSASGSSGTRSSLCVVAWASLRPKHDIPPSRNGPIWIGVGLAFC